MLNPSTADASADDPTIRRCVNFAKAWGAGSIEVVNLYAYRATDPKALKAAMRSGANVIGHECDSWIRTSAGQCNIVVAAWGAHVISDAMINRARVVTEMIRHRNPVCLGKSSGGMPRHPLMLSGGTKMEAL